VADYFSFNPLLLDTRSSFAPEEQVRRMLGDAQDLDLKVMVDLVINHCAVDAPLVKAHPEWFVHDNGRIAHPHCMEANGNKVVWTDLAQFDYYHTPDREGLVAYFMKIVDYLVDLGFRGFRCDAAYQIPNDIWRHIIEQTRARHGDIVFAAETLGCTPDQTRDTAHSGFDYVFNSAKWWDFHSNWLMEQYNLIRETAPSISFPESHDTPRLCAELDGHVPGLKQKYLFTALFSAGVMMPIGYEFGFRKPLHVVKSRPADWEADTGINLREYIRDVNRIKNSYRIFQEDAPTHFLPANNGNILVMWKASAHTRDEMLLILNKDIYNQQTYYADSLRDLMQSGAPLRDISPGARMEYLPMPFHYDLAPGQGLVFITQR
jgi:starch synthase (maltosyl-transferring)